jgi:hypothetical protein
MKTRGLPGAFAPGYHELQVGWSLRGGHLVDVGDPGFLGLDALEAPLAQVGDAVGDPVHVPLDRVAPAGLERA